MALRLGIKHHLAAALLLLWVSTSHAEQAKVYPELEPYLKRAGGLSEFLADSPKAWKLREEYLHQLQNYHGKERFTGEHFDQLLNQLRGHNTHMIAATYREGINVESEEIRTVLNGFDNEAKLRLYAKLLKEPPSDHRTIQVLAQSGLTQHHEKLQKRTAEVIAKSAGADHPTVNATLGRLVLENGNPRTRLYAASLLRESKDGTAATLSLARAQMGWLSLSTSTERQAASRAIALLTNISDPKRQKVLNTYTATFGKDEKAFDALSLLLREGKEDPELILELYMGLCKQTSISCQSLRWNLQDYLGSLKVTNPRTQLALVEQLRRMGSGFPGALVATALLASHPEASGISLAMIGQFDIVDSEARAAFLVAPQASMLSNENVILALRKKLRDSRGHVRAAAGLSLYNAGLTSDPEVLHEMIDYWYLHKTNATPINEHTVVMSAFDQAVSTLDRDSFDAVRILLEKLKKNPKQQDVRQALARMQKPLFIDLETWKALMYSMSQNEQLKNIHKALTLYRRYAPRPGCPDLPSLFRRFWSDLS